MIATLVSASASYAINTTTVRSYSRGKPLIWALNEIAQCAGEQFDPSVVSALEHAVAVQGADAFLTAPPVTVLTPLIPPAAFVPAQPIRSSS